MRFSQGSLIEKRPYAKISLKKREQLVKFVLEQNVSISKAAKRIKIKLTTARLIIKKFKETGTYPMKKFREPVTLPAEPAPQTPLQLGQASEANKFSDGEAISRGAETTAGGWGNQGEAAGCWPNGLVYYYWPCFPFGNCF